LLKEAPWSVSPNPVNPEWPEEGKVEFKDFKVRYRKGLDFVLRGLTFTISPMEKVTVENIPLHVQKL
jgi:ATP-binding cassette subfamily C (CFTR/MRP) protein 1